MLTRQQKRILSRIFNQGQPRRVVSLLEEPRFVYDFDTCTEYGFIQGFEDDTDEQVSQWFDENVRVRIPSWKYWDCTGDSFTMSIDWHRNPNGDVSYIHRIGYDY